MARWVLAALLLLGCAEAQAQPTVFPGPVQVGDGTNAVKALGFATVPGTGCYRHAPSGGFVCGTQAQALASNWALFVADSYLLIGNYGAGPASGWTGLPILWGSLAMGPKWPSGSTLILMDYNNPETTPITLDLCRSCLKDYSAFQIVGFQNDADGVISVQTTALNMPAVPMRLATRGGCATIAVAPGGTDRVTFGCAGEIAVNGHAGISGTFAAACEPEIESGLVIRMVCP